MQHDPLCRLKILGYQIYVPLSHVWNINERLTVANDVATIKLFVFVSAVDNSPVKWYFSLINYKKAATISPLDNM